MSRGALNISQQLGIEGGAALTSNCCLLEGLRFILSFVVVGHLLMKVLLISAYLIAELKSGRHLLPNLLIIIAALVCYKSRITKSKVLRR